MVCSIFLEQAIYFHAPKKQMKSPKRNKFETEDEKKIKMLHSPVNPSVGFLAVLGNIYQSTTMITLG